jgi:hypothetical protein
VAPAKPAKRIKKVAPNPAAAPAVARVVAGASGSKGTTGGEKNAATTALKCRAPASCMLAEVSSVESHESSPHEPLPRGLVPDVTMRLEHEASLHITSTAIIDGALASNVVAAIAAGDQSGDPSTLASCEGVSEVDKMLFDLLSVNNFVSDLAGANFVEGSDRREIYGGPVALSCH